MNGGKNRKPIKIRALPLIIICLFAIFDGAAQQVSLVQPFEQLRYTLKTNVSNKKLVLNQLESLDLIPIYSTFKNEGLKEQILLLDGETSSLSLDIKNDKQKSVQFNISTNLPPDWEISIRRQALLPDYYSYLNISRPDVFFYGDALPKLVRESQSWIISLEPNEVARVYIDIKVNKASFKEEKLRIKLTSASFEQIKEISLQINEKIIPEVPFNSVIFNNNSYQMGRYVDDWLDVGLNNLILYAFPTLEFDASGNIVGNINHGTEDSKEFRYVVDIWAKTNKPFLLYWTKRFGRLAPLADQKGNFLKPYSKEWNNAYINLVKASYAYIKAKNPEISPDIIHLYVEDEITSGTYSKMPSSRVKNIEGLLKEIKKEIPDFSVYLTLSMYSFPEDLKIASKYGDILVPLIYLPETISKRAPTSYRPIQAFSENLYDSFLEANKERIQHLKTRDNNCEIKTNSKGQKLGSYLVTKGKTSNILDFRALPLYSVLLGREGLSWWAFSDTKGSSWLSYDEQALDYSMVYNREENNPIYQFWNKDHSENIIPSIRLYAARAGIQDAKIFQFLISHKSELSNSEWMDFKQIIDLLTSTLDESMTQPDPKKYLTLDQYEAISQTLRRLYISL